MESLFYLDGSASVLREERCSLAAHQAEQEGSNEHNVEADADVGQKLNQRIS